MTVRWSADSLDDLDHIGRYIAQFDPVAAGRVLTTIARAADRLDEFPLIGTATRHRNVRKLSVPRYKYLIYYQTTASVLVLRVVHAHRRQ